MQAATEQAIDILGGVRAAARLLGVSPSAIVKWKRLRVPAERVLDLEQACEARVTRYELRPDIYPREG